MATFPAIRRILEREEVWRPMSFNPKRLAVEYYFGDLQYWKLRVSPPMVSKTAMMAPH